jgi:tetratricopeptide (TPR) repeat protein
LNKKFEYDVFISYCSNDKDAVQTLAEQLRKDGLKIWFDDWVIQVGDLIGSKIEHGLEKSRTLVMCMSQAYFESKWTTAERHTALFRDITNTDRRVIPLLLKDCKIPDMVAQIAYIDWRRKSNEAYCKLLKACYRDETPDRIKDKFDELKNIGIEYLPTKPPEIRTQEKQNSVRSQNNLIRSIPTFIGRDAEIAEILKIIDETKSQSMAGVVISSIDGMPGIGKTALAVQLAHLLNKQYPDAQLFLDCYGYTARQTPLNPGQILDFFLQLVGCHTKDVPIEIGAKSSLWRSLVASKRVVIVLDNVVSQEQVEPILPGTSDSLVLITSRNRLTGLSGVYPLPLDILSEADAICLLKRVAGTDAENETHAILADIARLCGYLPLALQITAARWRRQQPGYALILTERLRISQGRLESLRVQNVAVASAFELSYRSLREKEKKLFRLIGLHPGIDFTVASCSSMIEIGFESTRKLIDSLVDKSLIRETAQGRYRLHDLLREFAQKKHNMLRNSKAEEAQSLSRLVEYYIYCSDSAGKRIEPHRYRITPDHNSCAENSLLFRSKLNAIDWFGAEITNLIACFNLSDQSVWPVRLWKLSQAMAPYIIRSVPIGQVIDIHSKALRASQRCDNQQMAAMSLTDLAVAEREAGNFTLALDYFRQAESSWKSLNDKSGLAYVLDSSGFTLERVGHYTEALTDLNESLKLHLATGNQYGQANALNGIGAVNWRLEKYQVALNYFQDALDIRKKVRDVIGYGRTTNNIAFCHLRLGDTDRAWSGFIDALDIARKHKDYHGESVTLNNLGYTLIASKNYNHAIEYGTAALNLANQTGDNYQQGRAYDVLGKAYLAAGQIDQGLNMLQSAFDLFKKLGVPEEHETGKIIELKCVQRISK